MNCLEVEFSETAGEQYQFWVKNNPKVALKITTLIDDIVKHPKTGIGKPEALRHELSGYWSRHITLEHRLVYSFDEEKVYISSCRYHY